MINLGVIGTGMIGQDHIRRLTHVLADARVASVSDVDGERARRVASDLPDARVFDTGEELITSSEVDAVVVTSWGPTHEAYVLAALAADKPVFCEKPLSDTAQACSRILDAEVAAGRRSVQVGFMRRYDERYLAVRDVVHGGSIGNPLLMHAAHRNLSVPPHFTSDMIITDSAVHDIDVARWMFDEEITSVTVFKPRQNRRAKPELNDPLLLLLEMSSGVLVDVEVLLNASFGYDIRDEVICEDGTVALSESPGAVVKSNGSFAGRVPVDWRDRFASAFDAEFRSWLASVAAGTEPTGPSAWDGYAATVVCNTGLAALRSGAREQVTLRDKPPLYTS